MFLLNQYAMIRTKEEKVHRHLHGAHEVLLRIYKFVSFCLFQSPIKLLPVHHFPQCPSYEARAMSDMHLR